MLEKKKNRLMRIYLIAVIILLLFLHYLKITSKIEFYIFNILANWQNKTYTFLTKLKYSFINYQEAQKLQKENRELKEQINQLLYENTQLIAFKLENERLRTLLNFLNEKEFDYVMAKVIGKDINRANTLLINKGKLDGVKEGYPAVVDQGIIIGKVVEVKDHLSEILLLTDKLSQIAVSLVTVNKTTGIAQGEFGLSIKMELIPQNLELKEGYLIITSGQEEEIPRGLIIGKVNRLITRENELFKSATITPLVNYDEITVLSIIIP